jgi:dopamine receptor D2
MAQITTQRHLTADPNGNHDSGYAPSNIADDGPVSAQLQQTPPGSPKTNATIIVNRNATTNNKRNGSPRKEPLR